MAAVDKLYLNEKQNAEFYKWCGKVRPSLRDKMVCHHKDMTWDGDMNQYCAMFNEEEDKWLLLHSPHVYIYQQIMYQYDLRKIGDVIRFLED